VIVKSVEKEIPEVGEIVQFPEVGTVIAAI
jgi:hypothetical protein